MKSLSRVNRYSFLLLFIVLATCQSRGGIDYDRRRGNQAGTDIGNGSPVITDVAVRSSSLELQNKLKDVFNFDISRDSFPTDQSIRGFHLNVTGLTEADMHQYWQVGKKLADHILENKSTFLNCAGGQNKMCIQDFLEKYGSRLFGEPLSPADQNNYLALYQKLATESPEQALRALIESMILSPRFILYVESKGNGDLNSIELARRLSRFLWTSVPDETLMQNAVSGRLVQESILSSEITRMMNDVKFRRSLNYFFYQLLELNGIDSASDVSENEKASMLDEMNQTLHYLINTEQASIAELFTSPKVVISSGSINSVYEVENTLPNNVYELDSEKRPGLLTRRAFLTASTIDQSVSPIYRGLVIAKNLLCKEIGSPLVNVDGSIKNEDQVDEKGQRLTTREVLERKHSANPCAASCHSNFEPIGYAFENYLSSGEFRSQENGKPINPSGYLKDSNADRKDFANLKEFMDLLATSNDAVSCLTKQSYAYALRSTKLNELIDPARLASMIKKNTDPSMSFKQILADIALSEEFRKASN